MDHLDPEARSRSAPYKTRFLAKKKGEYFFIPVGEVESIEAEGNYVRVHVGSGTHLIRTSMNDMEATLDPAQFVRVHRGAIVNLDRVQAIQLEGVSDYRVVLKSNRVVKVGRTYRNSLLERRG
jgi:two-component system, LytTR family, response regulator